MTEAERAEAKQRFRAFCREHPGFIDSLPAVIIGCGNRDVCTLDATLDDLRNYAALLQRRIQRHQKQDVATGTP